MKSNNYKLRQRKDRLGSTFIAVIGIMGVIIFAATSFMSTTIQETKQTSMSIRGLHANSLAEASIERAMKIITETVNKVDKDDTDNFNMEKNFGFKLRYPATEGSSSLKDYDIQTTNLGSDKELSLSDEAKAEIEFTQDDLQSGDNEELDKLVGYMTDDGYESYEVKVKAKITNAFRNCPGDAYPDFKVPGVDIAWNTRYDVKNFLEGNGYTAFELKFPSDWEWLSISIPVEIMGIKITNINVTKVLDFIEIPIGNDTYRISDFTKIDTIASIFFNKIIGPLIGKDNLYPFEFKFDKLKDKMQDKATDLWPTSVTVADGQYIEKYGQITLECEAKITYKDKHTSSRRLTAVKDFKVADCEPPAPMYSLFINNLPNKYIDFTTYGGQFVVNNYDYSGLFGKIKAMFTGGSSNTSNEDVEAREFPGLIRVNYVDTSDTKTNPLICNVSCIGDTAAPTIEDDSSGVVKRFFQGTEVALIACPKNEMCIVGRKYNINASVEKKQSDTETDVPSNMKTTDSTSSSSNSGMGNKVEDYSWKIKNSNIKEYWKKELGLNLVPDVGAMSANVFELAATIVGGLVE